MIKKEDSKQSSADEIWGSKNSTKQNSDNNYKGFFTFDEASLLVQILAKLMASDGEIDTKELTVAAIFIRFAANDNDKECETLTIIFTKSIDANINVYNTVFAYKQKFKPNKAEIIYIIFLFLHMVYADGEFTKDERKIFDEIFKAFDINHIEQERIFKAFWNEYAREYRGRTREKYSPDSEQWDEQNYEPEPDIDPYEILGVSRDASFEEIKRARNKLVMENHPDRLGGNATPEQIAHATKRTQEINEAYEQIKEMLGK